MNYQMVKHLVCMAFALLLLLYLQCGPLGSVRYSRMACAFVMSLVMCVWGVTGCAAVAESVRRFRCKQWSRASRYTGYFAALVSGLSMVAMYALYLRLRSNGKEFYSDNLVVPPGLEVSGRAPADVVSDGFDAQCVTNTAPFMLVSEPLHFCFGAANPLRPGSVYVRVVNDATDEEMRQSAMVKSRWSRCPEESFCFKIALGPNFGRKGQTYVSRYELWFVSDDGVEDRMLMSKTYTTEGVR